MARKSKHIRVVPIQYRIKGKYKFHYGICIINRNKNIQTIIDVDTLTVLPSHNYDYFCFLENSVGNTFFTFD